MVEPTIASASGLPRDEKRALRERLTIARNAIEPAQRLGFEHDIGQRLTTLIRTLALRRVAAYWPISGEPDLATAWGHLAADGITLALPVVIDRHAPLVFRVWQRTPLVDTDLVGIPVPSDTAPLLDVDAVVAPCVGLHRDGWRLGYGGGYFDRTLAALDRRVLAIGIAFDMQRCDFRPDTFDRRLDFAVTPTAVEDYRAAS